MYNLTELQLSYNLYTESHGECSKSFFFKGQSPKLHMCSNNLPLGVPAQ